MVIVDFVVNLSSKSTPSIRMARSISPPCRVNSQRKWATQIMPTKAEEPWFSSENPMSLPFERRRLDRTRKSARWLLGHPRKSLRDLPKMYPGLDLRPRRQTPLPHRRKRKCLHTPQRKLETENAGVTLSHFPSWWMLYHLRGSLRAIRFSKFLQIPQRPNFAPHFPQHPTRLTNTNRLALKIRLHFDWRVPYRWRPN